MKSNNSLLWIIIVLLMAAVVALYFLFQPSRYNWRESYEADGKEPYDLKVFKRLLEKNGQDLDFQELTSAYKVSLNELDSEKRYNLFAIKRYYFPDTADLKTLEAFVRKGNNVFISANNISPLLPISMQYGHDSVISLYNHITSDELYAYIPDSIEDAYDEAEDWTKLDSIHRAYQEALEEKVWESSVLDSATVGKSIGLINTLNEESINLEYRYRADTLEHYWSKIELPFGAQYNTLSIYNRQYGNAIIDWQVGDGHVFIASTPLLFSNYHLQERDHFMFVNSIISAMPEGNILFDEVVNYNRKLFNRRIGANVSQSPLSFILNQRSLKWAWFTLLGASLLFVIFRAKRKQRIIPILKPNNNSTLAYAQLLGSLQLREKNNGAKGYEIYQHFLHHLRQRNRWRSNEVNDELKSRLLKLAPDLKKEIEYVIYLNSKTAKKAQLTNSELLTLFNYTNLIIERT